MQPSPALQTLWKRGCDFLGTRTAILGGAMSWVSEHGLVAAISNAGGFGVIACSAMGPAALEKEIDATRKLTNKPFGVNLIVMHPEMDALITLCAKKKVSHVVLAGGLPKKEHIAELKTAGTKTLAFAPTLAIGRKLVRGGVDALVIEGMEAGGHIGPVATSVLAQEILPYIEEVPVFVAGGIGRGEAIAALLEVGAAGCQLGTRFVCAEESVAHPKFKQAFINASARDAVPSTQVDTEFPVIPVRALANQATEDFVQFQHEIIARYRQGKLDKKAAQLEIEHFWAGALRRAVMDGDVDRGSVMAGQSVGMVTSIQKTEDIMNELVNQANTFLSRSRSAA